MFYSKVIFLILVAFFLFSNPLQAEDTTPRVFYSYESNGSDYLSSVGLGITFKQNNSNLGFQLNTSMGHAEILADDGYIEDYFSWEASAKFGYFSNLSLFVEVGFDLSEAIFHDLRYDEADHNSYEEGDDVDAFFGLGAGVQLGAIQLDAIIRLREIDSTYWEAKSDTFSGIQVSVNF